MNFTSSPFERMMKEVPHPGWDNDDPCKGCRYYKECKGKKKQCRKDVYKRQVYEVDGSDTDEEADLLNFDDLDSDEFV